MKPEIKLYTFRSLNNITLKAPAKTYNEAFEFISSQLGQEKTNALFFDHGMKLSTISKLGYYNIEKL